MSLLMVLMVAAWAATGCARGLPTIFATTQADGWSAQPVAINNRFTRDAALDPMSGVPVGDEGYYLYVLTRASEWDYRSTRSFIRSFVKHPRGHAWLILQCPQDRLECGHSGNYGVMQPYYHHGVIQKMRNEDPNPITYIWKTMFDGEFVVGNPGYDPTFVWRLPITKRGHERIYEYIMNRDYTQFSLMTYNCGEMVVQAAALAGVSLVSVIRITFPAQKKLYGHTLRIWTDPKYGVFEVRSMDALELDLRYLAQLGIGSDATAEYRASKPYEPMRRLHQPSELRSISVAEEPGK